MDRHHRPRLHPVTPAPDPDPVSPSPAGPGWRRALAVHPQFGAPPDPGIDHVLTLGVADHQGSEPFNRRVSSRSLSASRPSRRTSTPDAAAIPRHPPGPPPPERGPKGWAPSRTTLSRAWARAGPGRGQGQGQEQRGPPAPSPGRTAPPPRRPLGCGGAGWDRGLACAWFLVSLFQGPSVGASPPHRRLREKGAGWFSPLPCRPGRKPHRGHWTYPPPCRWDRHGPTFGLPPTPGPPPREGVRPTSFPPPPPPLAGVRHAGAPHRHHRRHRNADGHVCRPIPVIGVTARFALKPTVEGAEPVPGGEGQEESTRIMERRIRLLEQQVDVLESGLRRVEEGGRVRPSPPEFPGRVPAVGIADHAPGGALPGASE